MIGRHSTFAIRTHLIVGVLGFATLVGLFGGWAIGTEIVGAVITFKDPWLSKAA